MSAAIPGRSTVTTTEATRGFGRLLHRVARGEDVVITRRGGPRAVLVSVERYGALVQAGVAFSASSGGSRR